MQRTHGKLAENVGRWRGGRNRPWHQNHHAALDCAAAADTPLVPNAVIGMDRKPTAAELAAAYSKDGPQFLGHNVHAADYDPRAITIDHGNDIGNDTAFRHYILIPTR